MTERIGTPKNVATNEERPAIHVGVAPGLDEVYFNWVAVGAEEEGVPCRQVTTRSSDPVAIAYDAAMSSRFGVGVAVAGDTVVVHELHMPPEQPVITLAVREDFWRYCRLAGGNAARLIIRLPLRFELEEELPLEVKSNHRPPAEQSPGNPSPAVSRPGPTGQDAEFVRAITKIVARVLYERGML